LLKTAIVTECYTVSYASCASLDIVEKVLLLQNYLTARYVVCVFSSWTWLIH